jgi:hypothetical protein
LLGLFICLFYYLKSKELYIEDHLLAACIAITLGYLLVHIEARYVWLAGFVGAILILQLAQKLLSVKKLQLLILALSISLIIYPCYAMTTMYNKGIENFRLAALFQSLNIKHAKFTGNSPDAGKLWVAAYLSQNHHYTIEHFDFTAQQFEQEVLKYNVQYYVHEKELKSTLPNCATIKFVPLNSTEKFTIYEIKPLSKVN